MTLTLTLPRGLEQRLAQEARRSGVSADEYALRLLERSLATPNDHKALIGLLQSWIDEGVPTGGADDGHDLLRAIDEDRLSDRKLFPAELEGITW